MEHDVPWILIAFLLVLVILEVICIVRTGSPYTVSILEHIVQVVNHLGQELGAKDKYGERLCGTVLALGVIAALAAVLWSVHNIFIHANISSIIISVIVVLLILPLLLAAAWVNEHFISWRSQRRAP